MTGIQKRVLREAVNQWLTRMFAVGASPLLVLGVDNPDHVTLVTIVGDHGMSAEDVAVLLGEALFHAAKRTSLPAQAYVPRAKDGAK